MRLINYLAKSLFVNLNIVIAATLLLSSCADGLNSTDNSKVRTPQNVIANPGARVVELNWQGVAGATYNIYWRIDSGVDSKTAANVATTSVARFEHRDLTNGATYYYRVSAVTSEGESALSSQVQATPIPEPPNKPTGVVDAYPGDKRVTLVWPQQAALGASRYALLWRDDTTQEERRIEDVVSPYVHQGLENGVQYHYRLLGINDQGDGEPSDEMLVTPRQPVPAVPRNLMAQPTEGEITLTWDDNGQADRYELYWSTTADVGLDAQRIASVSTPYRHAPLQAGQTYYYRLRAVNSSGASALSGELMATAEANGATTYTPLSGNSPPALITDNIKLLPGDGQITIKWQSVSGAQGYAIYWNTEGNVSEADARLGHVTLLNSQDTSSPNQLPEQLYVHTGLTNGQTYYYRIAAFNDAGQTLSTPDAVGRPEKIVPGRPANVEVATGDQWVAVRWNPVQNAASYNVYWRLADFGTDDAAVGTLISNVQSPFTLDTSYSLDSNGGGSGEPLQNGIQYKVRVEAVSESGNQSCSDDIKPCTDWFLVTPQIPPPAPPDNVRLISRDGQITVQWQPNAGPVDFYHVYWGNRSGVTADSKRVDIGSGVPGNSTTSVRHNRLTNGKRYYYIVVATNAGGDSLPSKEVWAVPQIAVPQAPSGVGAEAGNAAVTLSWYAPDTVIDYPYNIYYRSAASAMPTVLANVAGTEVSNDENGRLYRYTINSLSNGTRYYFKVSAINTGGEGTFSREVMAEPYLPPAQQTPANLRIDSSGDSQIALSWDATADADHYTLYWSTVNAFELSNAPKIENLQSTTYEHTGRINGVTYYYRVVGATAGGEGPPSDVVFATPQMASPQLAPANFTVTPGDQQVRIDWGEVDQAQYYHLYWSTDLNLPLDQWTRQRGVTPGEIIRGLVNGTTYHYFVRAANPGGEGPESNIVSATPQMAAPLTPSGFSVSPADSQIIINWDAQPGVTYNLYWRAPGVANLPQQSGVIPNAQATYIDTRPNNGETYFYRLSAVNVGGESPLTAELSATPAPPPANAPLGLTAQGRTGQVELSWMPPTGVAADTTYTIYWSQTSGAGTSGTAIAEVTSPYVHQNLNNGTAYYYVVTATTGGQQSPPSLQVQATPSYPAVGVPNGVFTVAGDGEVTINWGSVANAIYYTVYWSTDGNLNPSQSFQVDVPNTQLRHTNLTNGTTYYYWVSATGGAGEGRRSGSVTANPNVEVNQNPVITQGAAISRSVPRGNNISINLNVSDIDSSADSLSWSVEQLPTYGTAQFVSTNTTMATGAAVTLNYTHTASNTTSDSLWVRVEDSRGGYDRVQVQVDVTNGLPVASDDTYQVNEGARLEVPGPSSLPNLLSNDSDPDGDTLSVIPTAITDPLNGALTLNADGSFIYDHDGSETTQDSFEYQISDGVATDIATVTLTIVPQNDPPQATNLSAPESFTEGDSGFALAAINVSDPDSEVTATLTVSDPQAGTLSTGVSNAVSSTYDGNTGVWSASGAVADVNSLLADVIFTPATNYDQNFEIATAVNDGQATVLTGTKIISVIAVNDPPVIDDPLPVDVSVSMDEDGNPIPFSLTLNAADVENNTLIWSVSRQANHGIATAIGTGFSQIVNYTPNNNYNGSDDFIVLVDDQNGGTDTILVSVIIAPQPDQPTVDNPILDQSATQDIGYNFTFAADTFSDADGDALTYSAQLQGGGSLPAWLNFDGPSRTFSGTPANADVTVTPIDIEVTADDSGNGGSISDVFALTVNNQNDPPQASPATGSLIEDDTVTQISGNFITDNVTDIDVGDTLSITGINAQNTPGTIAGTYGSLTWSNDGSYTYTLNNGDTDTNALSQGEIVSEIVFTYVVSDGADSDSSTLSILITGANDAPSAIIVLPTGPINDNQPVQFSANNPIDPEGDLISYAWSITGPANLSDTTQNPTVSFSTGGVYTVSLTLGDSLGAQNIIDGGSVTVNQTPQITGQNQNPIPVGEDTLITLSAAQFIISDPDNTPADLTLTVLPPAPNANYTINGNDVTPVLNYNGPLSVPVTVSDLSATSAVYNAQLNVTAQNDPPVITGQNPAAGSFASLEDANIAISLDNLVVTDVDNLNYPTGFSLNVSPNPASSYTVANNIVTPDADFNGQLDILVTVRDGSDDSNTYTLVANVTPQPDAPVVNNPIATQQPPPPAAQQDSDYLFQYAADTFTDADGDTLTYTAQLPGGGQLPSWLNFDGPTRTFSGRPSNADVNPSGFTIEVIADDNGNGGSATDSFVLVVDNQNDPPQASPVTGILVEDDAVTQISGNFITDNVTDIDVGDILVITQINGQSTPGTITGTYGSLTWSSDGSYTYILNNADADTDALRQGQSGNEILFNYIVSDSMATDTSTLSISITGNNDLPTAGIVTPATSPVAIDLGGSVNFTGSGNDAEDAPASLGYLWTFGVGSGIPDYPNQDPGTITFNNSGSFQVTLMVTDTDSGSSTPVTRTINVAANQPPSGSIDAPTSDQTIDVGDSIAFQASASDPDNHLPIRYAWSISNGTTTLTSTEQNPSVTFAEPGDYLVTLAVTDNLDLGNAQPIPQTPLTIHVNGAPQITTPSAAVVVVDISEDGVPTPFAQQRLTAQDPNGDNLTWQLGSSAAALGTVNLVDNGDGTVSVDYAPNANLNGQDIFSIDVFDSRGLSDTVQYTVNVSPQPDAPVVNNPFSTQQPPPPPAQQDSDYVFQFAADTFTDADGDSLTYTAQLPGGGQLPSWLNFDGPSRTFSGRPSNADVDPSGFTIEVIANDSSTSVTDTFILIVDNLNDPPQASPATGTLIEDDAVTQISGDLIADNVTDIDVGDTLSLVNLAGLNGPSSVTGTYGTLTWNADNTYTYTLNNALDSVNSLGEGEQADEPVFGYVVTDGTANVASTLTITIVGSNDAPTAIIVSPVGSQNISVGEVVNFAGNGTDPEDDANGVQLNYRWDFDPASGVTINPNLSQNPGDITFSTAGSFNVALTVTDSLGLPSAQEVVQINVNGPPQLINNNLSINEGQTVLISSANLSADDADDDNTLLSFTVSAIANGQFERVSGIPGVAIDTFTQGDISANDVQFVHDGGEDAPSYSVTVSDGRLSNAGGAQAATIAFTNVNDQPIFNNPPGDQVHTEGDTITLANAIDASATDADGDTLSYSATDLPPDLTIDLATGQISGTIAANTAGQYNVEVTANDGADPATTTFQWTVNPAPLDPTLSRADITAAAPLGVGMKVSIVVYAVDAAGEAYTDNAQVDISSSGANSISLSTTDNPVTITNNGNGTYTSEFYVDVAGTDNYTVTIDGSAISGIGAGNYTTTTDHVLITDLFSTIAPSTPLLNCMVELANFGNRNWQYTDEVTTSFYIDGNNNYIYPCAGLGINDLSGVDYLSNLQDLYLYGNTVRDVTMLADLRYLNSLGLGQNGISTINQVQGLSTLPNVVSLWLGNNTDTDPNNNTITDYTDLSGMPSLRELIVWRNGISDLTSISGLTNLTKLWLLGNPVYDLTALSNLNNLIDLGISGIPQRAVQPFVTSPDQFTGLTNLSNLEILWIAGDPNTANPVVLIDTAGITPLNFPNLRELYLYDNQIDDVSGLAAMTNLTTLNLSKNAIGATIQPAGVGLLSALTSATYIDLSTNPTMGCNELQILIDAFGGPGNGVVLPNNVSAGVNCTNGAPTAIITTFTPSDPATLPAQPPVDVVIALGTTIDLCGIGNDSDNLALLTYVWDYAGAITPNDSGQLPMTCPQVKTFNTAGQYTLSFTVTDEYGYNSIPATRTIIVNTPPTATITPPAGAINDNEPVQFSATNPVDAEGQAINYQWNFTGPANLSYTVQNPSVTFPVGGTYNVSLTLTDSLGTQAVVNGGLVNVNQTYTVTATAGPGGQVDGASQTAITVISGDIASITVFPEVGYDIDSITSSCGGALSNNVFTTGAVTSDCSVSVSFLAVVDTTPDAFSFTSQTNVALSTMATTETIAVTGINTGTPISVSGGLYSINGGAFTSAGGTVTNGNSVQVRQTSSSLPDTTTTATLTIGDVSADFRVTTEPPDTIPDAFTIPAQNNVALNTVATSYPIIVFGINTATQISVSGGSYSINGGVFTSADGTVTNLDSVRVQQTSSAIPSTTTTATLTIGGMSSGFSVTTIIGTPIAGSLADATLQTCVTQAAGTRTSTEQITSITCYRTAGTGVQSLAGIEKYVNLQSLYIFTNHQVTDLSPLSGLTSLSSLGIYRAYISIDTIGFVPVPTYTPPAYITDISPLANLTNLTMLNLGDNQIRNISALSNLTGLTYLVMQSNGITDISPLQGLTALQVLDLGGNSISDISWLAQLNQLRELKLVENNIADTSVIQNFPNLTRLDLSANPLSNLNGIVAQNFPNLEYLGLRATSTSSLAPLNKPFPSLTTLNLYGSLINSEVCPITSCNNNVSNISALNSINFPVLANLRLAYNPIGNVDMAQFTAANFPSLNVLDLSRTNVTDVTNLSSLPVLSGLTMTGNGLGNPDLARFSTGARSGGFSQLSSLGLSSNSISDVTPLGDLSSLSNLSLSYNSVVDITPLTGLTNLWQLDLRNNLISTLPSASSLSNMTNLYSLNLSNNLLTSSSLSPLSSLAGIEELNLGFNAITSVSSFDIESMWSLYRLYLNDNNLGTGLASAGLTTYFYYGTIDVRNNPNIRCWELDDLVSNGATVIPSNYQSGVDCR